ncbi:MAG: glycosyltransferase family 4 protein [Actinobacteria bacterium]|nr:glycosyltransferase family 4 protein [Actinomycetota bacterium]
MPRVLVNLLWLVPGIVGGSEESTTDALRALAAASDAGTDVPLDVHLAVLSRFAAAHPDLAARFPLHVLDQDGSDKRRRVLAEQTWLVSVAGDLRADVVHHAGGVLPLRHPARTVLTVHDLQPLDHPENFRRSKRLYIAAMAGRSARSADVVAVPSAFSRDRVVDRLGVEADRVVIVPWWVARPDRSSTPESFPLPSPVGDDPFVLYPAITYPHKNHLLLLDAFALVARRHPDLRLVLTGGSAAEEGRVRERMGRPDLDGRVLRTGRVSAAQLESLFAAAVAVAVPSTYEGFGLPVLEAMVRGVPVVAADAGSLPEVARPEDLVPLGDVAAWAAAIEAVVGAPPAERAIRIAAGRRRAARFTPERTATALADAYRRAALR